MPTKPATKEKIKYDRSISSFKNHLKKASRITLKNSTGEADVEHIYSGDNYITFKLNGQVNKIKYPRGGYMRLIHQGKLVFLDGFNGNVTLECTITGYKDGTPVPDFVDYPDEELDYVKRTRKKKAA